LWRSAGFRRQSAGHQRANPPVAERRRCVIRRALVALAVLSASPALADTLIDDVNGITIDREGKVTHFAAMVIDEQGRIVQVLDRRERPPKVDYREDGRGRT